MIPTPISPITAPAASARPPKRSATMIGATMAGTDTRFAIDPKTGKIIWKHQVLPEDNWDQECTFEMMPITTPVHPDPKAEGMFSVGRGVESASRKTLTGVPCKTCIMWSFDALKGNYLWSKSTVLQNLVAKIDSQGRRHHQSGHADAGHEQDLSHLPDLCRRPRLGLLRLQPPDQCDVCRTAESLRRHAGAHRQCSQPAAQSVQHVGAQISLSDGKTNDRPHRRHQCGNRQDGVELGDPGLQLFARSWRRRAGCSSMAAWIAISAPWTRPTARCCGRPGWARRCSARRSPSASRGGNISPWLRAAASMAGQRTPMPGIDQPSGANMVYVFALPE